MTQNNLESNTLPIHKEEGNFMKFRCTTRDSVLYETKKKQQKQEKKKKSEVLNIEWDCFWKRTWKTNEKQRNCIFRIQEYIACYKNVIYDNLP